MMSTWYAEEAVPKRKLEGSTNEEDKAVVVFGEWSVFRWA